MRFMTAVLGLIAMAAVGVASADEPRSGPAEVPTPAQIPAMPLPTFQRLTAGTQRAAVPQPIPAHAPAVSPTTPPTRLDLLRAALEKLEAAGASSAADSVREEIAREEQTARHQLEKKLAELQTLQAEVDRLRAETGAIPTVLVKLKVIDIDVTKLRQVGFDFRPIVTPGDSVEKAIDDRPLIENLLAPTDGQPQAAPGHSSLGVIPQNHRLHALLDMLEQQEIATVVCEPNLVAYNCRRATFLSGGQFPVPSGAGGTNITMKNYGTEVEFTPQVLADGRVQIDIWSSLSELDTSRLLKIGDYQIPALKVSQINTRFQARVGETFVCAGLAEKRARPVRWRIPLGDLVMHVSFTDAAPGTCNTTSDEAETAHLFKRLFLVTLQSIDPALSPAPTRPETAAAPGTLRR
jgi:hypothetical protein